MNLVVTVKCKCGIVKIELDYSKKQILSDGFSIRCNKCKEKCEISNIKTVREEKLNKIKEGIK